MSNPTTPTIAELWRAFEILVKKLGYETERADPNAPTILHFKVRKEQIAGHIWNINELLHQMAPLRAQLIERCALEYGLKIHSEADGSAWIYETWISPIRICGINDTRNRAASLNFMAWELDQRQNEAQI